MNTKLKLNVLTVLTTLALIITLGSCSKNNSSDDITPKIPAILIKANSPTGESPYTTIQVDGQPVKVHLHERKNYPEHFATPSL